MTVYYPDDPDGPLHSLWWYMVVKARRTWLFMGALWLVVALLWIDVLPDWGWTVVTIVSWSYCFVAAVNFRHSWVTHKEEMRRIDRRHAARMIQMNRQHEKVMQRLEGIRRNARWN